MPTYTVRVPAIPPVVTVATTPVAHADNTVTWEPPTPGTPGSPGSPGTLTLSAAATPNQSRDLITKLGLVEPSILGRGAQTFYDDFNRADGPLNGSQAVTGQVWRAQGNAVIPAVASRVLSFAGTTPSTPIIGYCDLGDANEIECSYSFDGTGTTHAQNVVLGFAQSAFAPASIQIFHYARTTLVDVGSGTADTNVDWLVQAVYVSGTQQYTTLAHGLWANSFVPPLDGSTRLKHRVRRVSLNTIAVPLPDGTVQPVTNSLIGQYFGTTLGVQLRRRNSTDGYATFYYVAAAAGTTLRYPQPTPGSDLSIPGDGLSYAATAGPGVSITDFDIRTIINPNTITASTDLVTCWDPVLGRAFALSFTSGANPFLRVWSDGTSGSQMGTSSTSTAPSGGTPYCLGVSRVGSTGAINYYITTDLTAVDYPLTDSRWGTAVTRTSTAGSSFASAAPLQVGYPAVGNGYTGTIRYLAVRSGLNGTILAGFDLRKPFTGRGLAQELWHMHGAGWSWSIQEAGVSGLASDLAAIRSSITALGAGLYKHHQSTSTAGTAVASGGSTANDILYVPTSVPAASLAVGQLYKFRAMYSVSTGGTSGAFTDHWQSGPAGSLVDMDASSLCASQTSAGVLYGWIDLDMLIMATGSSGKILTRGFIYRPNVAAGTGALIAIPVTNTAGPVTLDLSTAFNPQMKVTTPVPTSGTNQFTLLDASLDQIH